MEKQARFREFYSSEGKAILFPVITIKGDEEGPHAVITAGIHGAEYPPILAALEFCEQCDPAQVKGTITVIPICGTEAFRQKSVFVCPVDQKNPNRCFPGRIGGSYTEELVYHLFTDLISKGDYHIDLHAGDLIETLSPFAECCEGVDEEVDRLSKEIALYYGSPDIVITQTDMEKPGEGLCYMNSARHHIPSAIVEAGQMGQCDRESVERHLWGLRNVLRRFGNLPGEVVTPERVNYYRDWRTVSSPARGIFYPAVRRGDLVDLGQRIGEIRSYLGERLAEVVSPVEGKALYLASSPAVDEGEFLLDLAIR